MHGHFCKVRRRNRHIAIRRRVGRFLRAVDRTLDGVFGPYVAGHYNQPHGYYSGYPQGQQMPHQHGYGQQHQQVPHHGPYRQRRIRSGHRRSFRR